MKEDVHPSVRRGDGEPVLLLHGFTLSHHVWHGVVDDLAGSCDVFAPSMPGHWGGPKLPWSSAGVRGLADGVEQMLDDIGWGRCHVVGNSLGGQLAFELELRGRALSVLSINSGVGLRRLEPATIKIGVAFAGQYPRALLARAMGDRAATSRRIPLPILANCSHSVADVSAVDSANVMRAVSHCETYIPSLVRFGVEGVTLDLQRVAAPTTVLISEYDIYPNRAPHVRDALDRLPQHINQATLAGVGHVPMLENPSLVAEAIQRHLAWTHIQ